MLELTLDEAIKHCKENVQKETQNGNLQCAIEHNQLAIWLSQLEESKAKASAYDRLMTGGKKTPKEVANFLDLPIAQDKEGFWYAFGSPPVIDELRGTWGSLLGYEKEIPSCNIRYSGDWKDSLTMPDGWE